MNASELVKQIGRVGFIRRDGMDFEVKITDVKQSYGKVRYLIMPTRGHGEAWVEAVRYPTHEVSL